MEESFRFFQFDLNGSFINEMGTYGRGPGEHTYNPEGIRYYTDDSLIQVNWGGRGREPQLFDLAGNFVRDVHVPAINSTKATLGLTYLNDGMIPSGLECLLVLFRPESLLTLPLFISLLVMGKKWVIFHDFQFHLKKMLPHG